MAGVDKILVGSPTYKQVIGNVTRVNKVVVGVPLSTVTIGPYADIDNIVGVDTSNKQDGGALVYDSDSGNFVANREILTDVDGKTYPSDSAHTNILIRRSGTQGEPVVLQQGELAYSYLADPSTDGFGNGGDRLYIATGDEVGGISQQIDVIGGKYFTQMLNHQHGILTPNSALIVDENKRINEFFVDSATFTNLNLTDLFVTDITFTGSRIKAEEGKLTSLDGNTTYLDWGNLNDIVRVYGNASVGAGARLSFDTQSYDLGSRPPPRPSGTVASVRIPNALNVQGYTFLDSTEIEGDLDILKGNFSVQGKTADLDVSILTVKDKRPIFGKNVPNVQKLDQAGIAFGDSDAPLASITYNNNSNYDSATWVFDPGIEAPFVKTDRFEFTVIDCGTYA